MYVANDSGTLSFNGKPPATAFLRPTHTELVS